MSSGDVFQFAAQQQLSSPENDTHSNSNSSNSNNNNMNSDDAVDREEYQEGRSNGRRRRTRQYENSSSSDDSDDDDDDSVSSNSSDEEAHEPSFASANFATILPEYRNRGQDAVKLAFVPHSFSSIRDLPDHISHKSVEHSLFDKAATNLHSDSQNTSAFGKSGRTLMGYKNLFSQFEYVHETYDLEKELNAQEERRKKEIRLKIGKGREFVNTKVIEKPLPGQDEFMSESSLFYHDERLKSRHKWQSDPIERFQEMVTRERQAKRAANINPAFCPGGVDTKVDPTIPSRVLLPDILRAIAATVVKDWPDVGIKCVEENSCIVVEFNSVDADDASGVAAYMRIFCKKNHVALRYKLKKNSLRWNQVRTSPPDSAAASEGSTISVRFSMIPPWIRGKDLHNILNGVKASAPTVEYS